MSRILKTPIHKAKDLKLGTKRKGRDGKMWYVLSNNGSKYWSKTNVKKSSGKIYSGSKTAKPKITKKTSGKTYNSKTVDPKIINKSKSSKTYSGSKTAKPKIISKSKSNKKKSNRKGPVDSATLFKVDTIKKGKDNKLWIIKETMNGIKRWFPYKNSSKHIASDKSFETVKKTKKQKTIKWNMLIKKRQKELSGLKTTKSYTPKNKLSSTVREYYIHDNGGKPFKVSVNKKEIDVYIYKSDDPEIYKKRIIQIKNFIGFWYGFDASPRPQHGNSILVQINANKYVYIGSEIYEFKTKDKILDYISPIGNSDVPYPVAYGTENVYFLLDRQFIKNDELETPITVANSSEIYGEYYGHIGTKKGTHNKHNILNIKFLQKRNT